MCVLGVRRCAVYTCWTCRSTTQSWPNLKGYPSLLLLCVYHRTYRRAGRSEHPPRRAIDPVTARVWRSRSYSTCAGRLPGPPAPDYMYTDFKYLYSTYNTRYVRQPTRYICLPACSHCVGFNSGYFFFFFHRSYYGNASPPRAPLRSRNIFVVY